MTGRLKINWRYDNRENERRKCESEKNRGKADNNERREEGVVEDGAYWVVMAVVATVGHGSSRTYLVSTHETRTTSLQFLKPVNYFKNQTLLLCFSCIHLFILFPLNSLLSTSPQPSLSYTLMASVTLSLFRKKVFQLHDVYHNMV